MHDDDNVIKDDEQIAESFMASAENMASCQYSSMIAGTIIKD